MTAPRRRSATTDEKRRFAIQRERRARDEGYGVCMEEEEVWNEGEGIE